MYAYELLPKLNLLTLAPGKYGDDMFVGEKKFWDLAEAQAIQFERGEIEPDDYTNSNLQDYGL